MDDAPAPASNPPAAPPAGGRSLARRALTRLRAEAGLLAELLALAWLAVAQPVLSVYERTPEQFVLQRADGGEIILFALLLTAGPALALWALTLPLVVAPDARRWLHRGLAAALVGVAAAGIAKEVLGRGSLRVGVPAVLAAAAFAVARTRWDAVGRVVRTLAVASPIYLAWFLLASPVAPVVSADEVTALGVAVERPAPIVFLVFDELPTASLLDGDGHIDEQLFPAFASLAADSTWHRNTTTVAPYTEAAVPAILTGQMPQLPRRTPTADAHPQNLFSLLDGTYDLDVTESPITFLCQSTSCETATKAPTAITVRTLLDEAGELWRSIILPTRERSTLDFAVEDMPEDLEAATSMAAFIDGIRPSERPRLHFLHVLLPHQPWWLLPDGRTYDAPSLPVGVTFFQWDDEPSAERGRQRHLLQLLATDRLLGDLLDRLRDQGIYDDALIVLTADHGAAFTVGSPERGASPDNLHEIAFTPLLIKAPGQTEGIIDDLPARSIDVLPTVAELLGFEPPVPFDGSSLLDSEGRDDERVLLDWELSRDELEVTDDYVHFDGAPWFDRLLATPGLRADADVSMRPFRVGPRADLVGRSLDDLEVGAPSTLTAQLWEPAPASLAAPLDPAHVPIHVDGTLSGDQPLPVALVVNGRVALVATTRAELLAAGRFWGLIPPSLLHDGPNEVALYLVEGDDESTVLHAVSITEPESRPPTG